MMNDISYIAEQTINAAYENHENDLIETENSKIKSDDKDNVEKILNEFDFEYTD